MGRHSLPPQLLIEKMTTLSNRLHAAIDSEEQTAEKAFAATLRTLETGKQQMKKARDKANNEALEVLGSWDALATWNIDLAISNGMVERKATLHNAQAFIESDYAAAKSELAALDALAKDKGCSSVRFLIKAYKQISDKNRPTLAFYKEVLPEWATVLPIGLKRFTVAVGQKVLERKLLQSLYPALHDCLESKPDGWIVDSVRDAWEQCENLEDVETIGNWIYDRLEGLEEERPTDLIPLAPWIEELQLHAGGETDNLYGPTFLPSIAAVAQAANWQATRRQLAEVDQKHTGGQVSWLLREYTGASLDQRVGNGLILKKFASQGNKGTMLGSKVTLDLYLECFWALQANGTDFESHEDAYECVADALEKYEAAGNTTKNIEALLAASTYLPTKTVEGETQEANDGLDVNDEELMGCLNQLL